MSVSVHQGAPQAIGACGAPWVQGVPIELPWSRLEPADGLIPPLFHLDFETFNELNLKKVGGDRYCRHPSLEIILLAWQTVAPDSVELDIQQTESEAEALDVIADAARDPETVFAAFNAAFERHVLAAKGIDIPASRWVCVMAWAYSMAFNGSLRDVGEQLGLPTDALKLKSGTRLINKFCTPRRPSKKNPSTRWRPEDAPEDWEQFKLYNRTDVISEIHIAHKLMPYFPSAVQRAEYAWDAEVNDLGLPIDTELVDACCDVYAQEQDALKDRMRELTRLDNPASVIKLKDWLNREISKDSLTWQDRAGTAISPLPDLTKETVRDALAATQPGSLVHQVLTLREMYARASPKKWLALKRATAEDGRLRGTLQLWGAGRTQRWAGRIFQGQNLPWPDTTLAGLPELMLTRSRRGIEMIHPSVTSALVSLIRNAVTAKPGNMLAVADLSSIESVVIGYLSGCAAINKVFAEGRDLYKDFGSQFFRIAEELITKAQRQFSKPPVLACGYGITPRGLVAYAAGMGVPITEEEAERLINTYHQRYPEVKQMWYWLETVMKLITTAPALSMVREGYGVRIWRDEDFLRIQKPNGWCLSYYRPQVIPNKWGRSTVTYMGKNQYTGKWERLWSRGALVTENIVQSFSRDVLMHGLWLARGEGLNIVGHVHDEGIDEERESFIEQALKILLDCLTARPAWAPELLLGAEGHIMKRYEKK